MARQWFRHRTGSYNEVSLRYSEAPDEYYIPIPEWITTQDSRNKQARTTTQVSTANEIIQELQSDSELLLKHYQEYLQKGTAREIARINLPLSLYTTFMFKIDLRNLLNFLHLRLDSHAQFEIRQYAILILKMVENYFPLTIKAWKDYIKESITFSKSELDILHGVLEGQPDFLKKVEEKVTTLPPSPLSVGEKGDFLDKIRRLLGLPESHSFLE